ncbi:DUF1579 family protein [Methanolobus chelungpuianus]|uniref:DUF1579 domain-containing protein n=1 Tax=Methanolobus chelungpuianus TaxID=502115 RepID=A0AAE3HD25_9EURY|nr:DUF1579 family protein [Methanolobus chelungpuianus]MCQ6963759.1 hypothetical protein [Methanolobus chelungpuianus]
MNAENVAAIEPDPALKALDIFVGKWITEGEIKDASGLVIARLSAADTYEWLRGGFFLLHRWEAQMDGDNSEGIEIIGYDPSGQTYLTQTFDSKGNFLIYRATLQDKRWNIWGRTERFTGMFGSDGKTLTGTWERLNGNSAWVPWMDIQLTKKGE